MVDGSEEAKHVTILHRPPYVVRLAHVACLGDPPQQMYGFVEYVDFGRSEAIIRLGMKLLQLLFQAADELRRVQWRRVRQ